MKISILVPSRGRKIEFERMQQSAIETATNPELIEFVVYRDADDLVHYAYLSNTIICGGERIVLSQMWNRCYDHATGEIFMHCGDDIIFKTKGWDEMVRAEFKKVPDRIVFVHGDDGANKDSFGTHGFLHKNWVNAVGYFVPPYFSSDYNDTWLNDVANAIGRRVALPFLTEHMHFVFGKGPKDQTHLDRIARHEKDDVGSIYTSKKNEREVDVKKLQEFINNFSNK